MKIAIIQFPGSNCERETMLAVKRAEMQPIEFLWNESTDKLVHMDGYVIVGGFSYEDRSRAGIIAALDPIMTALKAEQERGKPILGICNGAQVLVESGLVPGLENNKVAMALSENKRVKQGKILGTGFYNNWVHMRLSSQYQRNAFTRHLKPDSILHIPVAHAEGRFVMSRALWEEISAQGLHVFQYCDVDGQIDPEFPVNPNGSWQNIAAIANKAGNVMAMMPHPERVTAGDPIFRSMRDYIRDGQLQVTPPLSYYPRRKTVSAYQKGADNHECIVKLMIADNHALSVQNALRQRGLPITVERAVHWEVSSTQADYQQAKQTGVLFNPRKELEIGAQPGAFTYLVRQKEDMVGEQIRQMLQNHYGFDQITAIQHGILWRFSSETAKMSSLIEDILNSHIIYNPYAHDCYQYE